MQPLEASGAFPPMVISMIDVGEETGQLPEMLLKIAEVYDDEVDNAVAGLTSMLEPIMIVLLALIVGTIVIALFMPLDQHHRRIAGSRSDGRNDECRLTNVEGGGCRWSSASRWHSRTRIGHSPFRASRLSRSSRFLVVMAIILVLAGLVLATSSYVHNKGARSRAEAEIAAMSAALENYKADNGVYPSRYVGQRPDARQIRAQYKAASLDPLRKPELVI